MKTTNIQVNLETRLYIELYSAGKLSNRGHQKPAVLQNQIISKQASGVVSRCQKAS